MLMTVVCREVAVVEHARDVSEDVLIRQMQAVAVQCLSNILEKYWGGVGCLRGLG